MIVDLTPISTQTVSETYTTSHIPHRVTLSISAKQVNLPRLISMAWPAACSANRVAIQWQDIEVRRSSRTKRGRVFLSILVAAQRSTRELATKQKTYSGAQSSWTVSDEAWQGGGSPARKESSASILRTAPSVRVIRLQRRLSAPSPRKWQSPVPSSWEYLQTETD